MSLLRTAREADTIERVRAEMQRQRDLKGVGRFPYTAADPELPDLGALCVLGEEFGEVCRAVNESEGLAYDKHGVKLREELIQVAAVAIAWASNPRFDDE